MKIYKIEEKSSKEPIIGKEAESILSYLKYLEENNKKYFYFSDVVKIFESTNLSNSINIEKDLDNNIFNTLNDIFINMFKNGSIFSSDSTSIESFMEKYTMEYINSNYSSFYCRLPSKSINGYPDLILYKDNKPFCYLEVKTYSDTNSSLRTFYYSFIHNPINKKINNSLPHFLIGYHKNGKSNNSSVDSFKLINLQDKIVSLKIEFNSSNKDIYK